MFNCKVGYSGHEKAATSVCIPAVMLGATSLERHVTIDRTMYGYDQAASLESDGIKRLVRDVRIIVKILLIFLVIFFSFFFIEKVDFPSPKKEIIEDVSDKTIKLR